MEVNNSRDKSDMVAELRGSPVLEMIVRRTAERVEADKVWAAIIGCKIKM